MGETDMRRLVLAVLLSLGVVMPALAGAPAPSIPPPPGPQPPPAGPLSVFNFTGSCLDCPPSIVDPTPPFLGTGSLSLMNYTLGTPILPANFYSFTFLSGGIGIGRYFPFDPVTISAPSILTATPGPAEVHLFFPSNGFHPFPTYFQTFATTGPIGSWCAGVTNCGAADIGIEGVWSYVAPATIPEPATLLLLGTGLLGLAAALRGKAA